MKILSFDVKVYVLKDISTAKLMQKQCELIDTCFENDTTWSSWHEANQFKGYSFAGFIPVEAKKIYREGNVYSFTLRTVKEELGQLFMSILQNAYTPFLKVLTIQSKTLPQVQLTKIYTLTPCILKTDQGYWRTVIDLDAFEKRLETNLVKKFNHITNTKIDEDFPFFSHIKFDNHKPIAVPYKNIKLLGDKLTLMVEPNPSAQKLAYTALGCGLLEAGSRGFGFCGYKFA
ncbi:CRISPR-associated endoribonuclease Cas6 [Acetobacterium sp. UBA5834]|jgi:CRISPR-associated endoribonuclease Cas6|uniref:CRISPR-associated endoribonuclease Cas6 n=1 Tax=Acetobacterium sp. UBA5834 TaxID=1945907 RepID=UPI00257F1C41|nr:CRISPR-associated endoribonuclease Cas6 [Acetobacterium sp. UBA5834]